VIHPEKARGFAVRQGDACIWIGVGKGKFDRDWRFKKKDHPVAESFDTGKGWLAVGTAGLQEDDRKKLEYAARGLAVELMGDRATVFCQRGPEFWQLAAYPATQELLGAWRESGSRVNSFKDQGAVLLEENEDHVAANREFYRQLHAKVREFESAPGAWLEVTACVGTSPEIDPLRLQVRKVKRTYNTMMFEGELISSSVLVPELRAGLTMEVHSDYIQKARLNTEEPIERRLRTAE
jgi:hypothetical protein